MNELIDKLLPYERNLFFTLNGSDSVLIDNAMWTYTGILTWLPMVVFIFYIAFRNQNIREILLVLGAIVLLVALSDQLSSSFFKPIFKRHRPTHHADFMNLVDIVRGYRGGQYGFISGHATNSFGIAVFFSLLFKNRFVTVFMIFWAALSSYSRIYLGVHFISDIVAGMFFGSLIGILVYRIYVWSRMRFLKIAPIEKGKSIYSKKEGNTLAIGMISYIILVILFSPFLSSISHTILP